VLNEDEATKLRGMLRHPGWAEVVRPRLVNRGRGFIQTLIQSEGERPSHLKQVSDEQIKGMYREVEWVLTNWENELRVFEHNKSLDNGEPVEATN